MSFASFTASNSLYYSHVEWKSRRSVLNSQWLVAYNALESRKTRNFDPVHPSQQDTCSTGMIHGGMPSIIKSVVLFSGLPGAGKSSILREIVKGREDDFKVLEYDDIQESLMDKASSKDLTLEAWRASRRKALELLEENIMNPKYSTLFVDDNFYLRSMRKQVYQTCQDALAKRSDTKIRFLLVWLDSSIETCLERNKQRQKNRKVPEEIINRMNHRFEPPSEQVKWEQTALRLDGSQSIDGNVANLRMILQHSLHDSLFIEVDPSTDPATEDLRIQEEQQKTKDSILHQADQSLRCCVQMAAKVRPQGARQANTVKKQLYLLIKREEITTATLDVIQTRFVESLLANDNSWTAEELKKLESLLLSNKEMRCTDKIFS